MDFNNVTRKIVGWLDYDTIYEMRESIPHANLCSICPNECVVQIVNVLPEDMMKDTGILPAYDFQIVTNIYSPEFYQDGSKTVIIRTPITENHFSYNDVFFDRCWDIHDAIGNKKYSITGIDGHIYLYIAYREYDILNNPYAKDTVIYAIKMIEKLACDYRKRLNNMGYNC